MSRGRINQAIKLLMKRTTVKEVTLPYTPPANGILLILIRASATGRFYETYSNALPGICDGYTVASGYTQGASFVKKGEQVKVTGSGNILHHFYYFVPLNISGADEP